jgi:hypothetical protein
MDCGKGFVAGLLEFKKLNFPVPGGSDGALPAPLQPNAHSNAAGPRDSANLLSQRRSMGLSIPLPSRQFKSIQQVDESR